MKFTVIVPTYNRSDRLEGALQSILHQTFTDYEIIVVDDGSTDGTKEFLEKYPMVRSIYQINQGPAAARNTGILAASGDVIAFLDSDDRWSPDKLERQALFLDAHPDVSLVHGYFESVNDRGELLPNSAARRRWWNRFRTRGDRYENWLGAGGCGIQTSTVAIRRNCFEKAGLFDPAFRVCEDYDLFLRIALHFNVGHLDGNAVSTFRYHGTIPIEKVNEAQIAVLKKHCGLLESNRLPRVNRQRAILQMKQTLTKLSFLSQQPKQGRKYFHETVVQNPFSFFSWPNLRYYAFSFIPDRIRNRIKRNRREVLSKHAKV